MSGSLLFVIASYFAMLAGFFLSRKRVVHVFTMASIIAIDCIIPVYLVLTKDWYKRLIEQEEIFSFMIWMHFILVLTLYALYVMQVMTALKILKGEEEVRKEHRSTGIGILIARGLVVLSAAMLIEPGS